jgi:Arc/MetJ-type ribon-helix-helix transcriptional regulator
MPGPVAKLSDSEKITINLGFVDLGRIDLLVAEGFYSNRTDLIRTAIRNQLDRHQDSLDHLITRKATDLGLRSIGREELEAAKLRGELLELRILGLLVIADDVSPELALATIKSIQVLGALHASTAVKGALGTRIR